MPLYRPLPIPPTATALRAAALTLRDDPFVVGDEAALHHESDALIVIDRGRIVAFGDYRTIAPQLPPGIPITHHRDALIVPGFIDAHVHYPQTQIIGAGGRRLIDWLNHYTFAAEQQFADRDHAGRVAGIFLDACLSYGTTTASVYCTVHPQSVDAFFSAAEARSLRMNAGKTLMDRHAPDALLDTAQRGYDESRALIERWRGRGRGRLGYTVTPRFAATSTPEQLELAGALLADHPDVRCQTHIAEQHDEIAWIAGLFPDRLDYLDVYDHYGLLGPRTLLGHGIHLTEREWQRCHDSGTSIAHCPTSNAFLGSGLFDWSLAKKSERPVTVALASDVGGGTTLSMLATMGAAHQIAQLGGHALSAAQSLFLATRGAAHALRLGEHIGSIAVGMEADLVVLDLAHSPLARLRMQHCETIDEVLFMLMTLADDRTISEVYVMGAPIGIRSRQARAEDPAKALRGAGITAAID
ncbi:MAG: guanine deaminase [Burkholderiaceae bacterium]